MATFTSLLESKVKTCFAKGPAGNIVHAPLSISKHKKDETLPPLWEQISKRKKKS